MNKNIIIGIAVGVVLIGGFAVYKMNSFIDTNSNVEDARTGFTNNRPGDRMDRTATEASFSDFSIGQMVSIVSTTTDGSLVAENITIMGGSGNFGPGPNGERPEGFGSGERPSMPEGGEFRGPGGFGGPNSDEFANRIIGEITEIGEGSITISTSEGEETVVVTSSTQIESF